MHVHKEKPTKDTSQGVGGKPMKIPDGMVDVIGVERAGSNLLSIELKRLDDLRQRHHEIRTSRPETYKF